ncbi:MAG TPA: glucosidase [Chitinophagales bacterium]|nr:glucosidase [Chitinophagales bacterium]
MSTEKNRLLEPNSGKIPWKKWGPYLTDRQWGTVREDYSADGSAWEYSTHDMARSKAYRWGEEGIAGISDDQQLLCFAIALWNKKDPILKERYFGLSGNEGNHGEDVKECYYYLDNTPTHSYMKMLYKYPQQEFPYSLLVEENRRRTKQDREFELIDTGIFNDDKYFDVFVEYAKNSPEDILIKITIANRSNEDAALNVLPAIWFRNTWSWGYDDYRPMLSSSQKEIISIEHRSLGNLFLCCEKNSELLFCDNDINAQRLYGVQNQKGFFKDGINNFIVQHDVSAVNHEMKGTRAAANYDLTVKAKQLATIRLRLTSAAEKPFDDFDSIFQKRIEEADEFYSELQQGIVSDDEKCVQRQAFAGMLWSKQFYYYDVEHWLTGDPGQPPPPEERLQGRNREWTHLNNTDILSMPDKWEFPWFASWDLAFHCIPFALIDSAFAKQQLLLLTREWYMHPNGQLPAYEWAFDDANPPVHAWAAWRLYQIDQKNNNGKGDTHFLESVFHKLLLNFTWWVNRKDDNGNNLFQGGFLGLDNIGVFDRNARLPTGGYIEQSDGTSWMAMYSLNMMRIALELAKSNSVYQDMATKFFEHFLYIAGAIANMGSEGEGLWDEEDQFFYDVLWLPGNRSEKLKVRSMVGLIPLFAVEILDHEILDQQKEFSSRLEWFLKNRPGLASLVSRWQEKGKDEKHLLSLLRGHRMKGLLRRALDETEFLSEYGVRSVSKFHDEHPYSINMNGTTFSVKYAPGESDTPLFGGNSNWRGPIWMPLNYLLIESLQRFHHYYGPDFKVEYPTNSGNFISLNEIATELSKRLSKIFLRNERGERAVFGDNKKIQNDPDFKDYPLFYECFHGENGRGVGASHQTGWTGLIAKLLMPKTQKEKLTKKKETENIPSTATP